MTTDTRTRPRVLGTWLALVAALVLGLAACGGGSQDGGSFGTGDEGSGTTPMESGGADSSGTGY